MRPYGYFPAVCCTANFLHQSATKTLQNFYALLTETSAGLVVFDGAKCYNNYTSTQKACNNKCGGFLPWAS
jgi:hypothetical protein